MHERLVELAGEDFILGGHGARTRLAGALVVDQLQFHACPLYLEAAALAALPVPADLADRLTAG